MKLIKNTGNDRVVDELWLKRLCLGRDLPDAGACTRFDRATRDGRDMRAARLP